MGQQAVLGSTTQEQLSFIDVRLIGIRLGEVRMEEGYTMQVMHRSSMLL